MKKHHTIRNLHSNLGKLTDAHKIGKLQVLTFNAVEITNIKAAEGQM